MTSAADCRRSVGPNTRPHASSSGYTENPFKTRVRMHAFAELFPFQLLGRVLADGGIQLGHLSRAGALMTKPSVRRAADSRQSFGL